jgi:hypothetical protein
MKLDSKLCDKILGTIFALGIFTTLLIATGVKSELTFLIGSSVNAVGLTLATVLMFRMSLTWMAIAHSLYASIWGLCAVQSYFLNIMRVHPEHTLSQVGQLILSIKFF